VARRKPKTTSLELFVTMVISLCVAIIILVIRLLLFLFDLITFYTSKYKSKSGNSFFKTYFNKGNYGEFKLYKKMIRLFPKERVFTNLYLEGHSTDETEIDVLAISPKGIYVLEMKNYSGYIYGSEKDKNWTQVFNRRRKYQFYNPLRQNYAHTKAVEQYLQIGVDQIHPAIVFSNSTKLQKITVSDQHIIIKLSELRRFVRKTERTESIKFNTEQMTRFAEKFILKENVSEEIKQRHINQVKQLAQLNQ